MAYSRKAVEFYIKTAVPFVRLIGRLQGGGIKEAKDRSNAFKGGVLTGYFARKYLPAVENLTQSPVTAESPETIWQFWSGPAGKATPEIVESSIESVRRLRGDFEHKALNSSTIGDYSDLPGYVLDKFNKKQMDYAHFSDLLRLNLLKNHGGIWMDATCYMTDSVPECVAKQDFFVFLTGDLTGFPYSFVQSCFIRAKKGSFLCGAWHDMCVDYWKKETKKLDYFQIHLMFKTLVSGNSIARGLFADMPHRSEDETHLLAGGRLFDKFDGGKWEAIKKASFFQKTTYKSRGGVASASDYPDTYFARLCGGGL